MMKKKMPTEPMNHQFKCIIFFVFLLLLQVAAAKTTTSIKEDIVLDVTIIKEGGRTSVLCRLTNGSDFPVCTASIRYKQVFYATLTDERGNELPHDEEWAQKYAQKTSRIYKRPRSHTGFQVNPGESVELKFFLEDAYPATSIKQASKMDISWESMYYGAETDFDGNPYQFPPDWNTSASLPLAELGIGSSTAQDDHASEATIVSDKANGEKRSSEASRKDSPLYLLLVAGVVVLAGLLLVIGFKKKSKSITRR